MKTLFFVVIAIFMMPSFRVEAEDMQKYLQDTQKMVRQGKYKEALKRNV